MSAASVEPVMTACPSWCVKHWPTNREGDLGMHAASTMRGERWSIDADLFFNHDRSEAAREIRLYASGDEGLTPEQARALARDLMRAADMLET